MLWKIDLGEENIVPLGFLFTILEYSYIEHRTSNIHIDKPKRHGASMNKFSSQVHVESGKRKRHGASMNNL